MGDEEPEKLRVKQPPRRAKVIIRKCKKPPTVTKAVSKTPDETKKVNGELSSENKNNDIDTITEVKVIKPKEIIGAKVFTRGLKRKISTILNDPIIMEESSKSKEENKEDTSIKFKGLKKRLLEQTEKSKDETGNSEKDKSESVDSIQKSGKGTIRSKIIKISKVKKKISANGKKPTNGDSDENQAESQAEYAQYLGLQPTMQFKCYRCGEKGFPSLLALNMHQRGCGIAQKSTFIANLQQDTNVTPADQTMLTNFRITRKVYLCSACGTYYENYNLFLHMRDVHKKHICLFCLNMFTIADKLADHLNSMHNIQESLFKSSEEFQNAYKGSCYLICCSCENMFNEREDYFHHQCERRDPTAKCNLCGVKCGHYYTCPNSILPRTIPARVAHAPLKSSKIQSIDPSKNIKQVAKNKTSEQPWMGKKDKGVTSSDNDEDYDISHAASFCHVDITDDSADKEKEKIETEDHPVVILDESESPKSEQLNTEESKSSEVREQKNSDISVQAHETPREKLPDTSENTENIILENLTTEQELAHKNDEEVTPEKEDVNVLSVDEETKIVAVDGKIGDEHDTHDSMGLDTTPIENENVPNCDKNEIEKEVPITDYNSKEPQNKNDDDESVSQVITATTDKVETDDASKEDDALSEIQTSLQKDDPDSSDTDAEPVTHLSVSQDESDSSSDDSSDEENKKNDSKQSIESSKDESASDSDDSNKSSSVVDEKTKNPAISIEDKAIENMSEEDNEFQETKSNTSNEASKDFHLNDLPSSEKQPEISSNDNDTADAGACQLPESVPEEISDGIPLAGEDIPAMALTLEDKLEDASPQSVVKECVRTSCLNCVYCSHATKIAVNGKQLALHLLAEHRYKPVKNNETSEDVITKLKNSLCTLEPLFFNTESYDSSDKSLNSSYDYTYECFQCRFVTKIHKELYVHKRKMHQKTVLLCVMCKSNFHSYSELLCHMCPGIYVSEDVNFRCCFCNLDAIPSGFRLLVHLRKSHHTCDICLEVAGDQQKLSTHMWKHKLNHLCYRCGIAYRNKPDITKHLFWKHGTESVLCKKCLQKKWPHVYHFCIPPTVFICEECNASFTKAVSLKVHKRLHGGELPYKCSKCDQKFVSKKLVAKHEDIHNQPQPGEKSVLNNDAENKSSECLNEHVNVEFIDEPDNEDNVNADNLKVTSKENEVTSDITSESKSKKKKKRDKDTKEKPVLDVYDLPPLNLSSESDSSDDENKHLDLTVEKPTAPVEPEPTESFALKTSENIKTATPENVESQEESQPPAPIVDGVWDNFHSYKAELEKRDSKDLSLPNILPSTSTPEPKLQTEATPEPQLQTNATPEPELQTEPISEPELQTKAIPEPELQTEAIPEPEEEESIPNWLMDHSYCLIPGKPKSPEEDCLNKEVDHKILDPGLAVPSEEKPAARGHSSSIDHAYATLNSGTSVEGTIATATLPEKLPIEENPKTPPPMADPPTESQSNSKKKQKTPKKKKHIAHSSSSSDSSSDTDSTNYTCKSNCSCSSNNSSSSNSSSSSSSSDSDSSTSEGRRRAVAKKERKKERLKHKHHKEEQTTVLEAPPQPQEEEPVVDIPVEPLELPIRESDLDTEESSTDEDFYDKYPQSHAKQQMEKRNKLMLLASVAPVNNGTVSPPLPVPVENPAPPPPTAKRKIKTKKRRKSQQSKKSNKMAALQNQIQPSTSVTLPSMMTNQSHTLTNHTKAPSPLHAPITNLNSDTTAGSGSENESTRLSKRKRVRNKFYGYSSDEEEQERPGLKWKKVDPATIPQPQTPGLSFQPTLTIQKPHATTTQVKRPKQEAPESSGSDEETPLKKEDSSNTSSSSCDSENETGSKENCQKEQTEKSDNLYCYCQCPYDEVSEMIACDGQDCTIEWFHFECVGIMVPPKGKWYCPDCRKRRDLM